MWLSYLFRNVAIARDSLIEIVFPFQRLQLPVYIENVTYLLGLFIWKKSQKRVVLVTFGTSNAFYVILTNLDLFSKNKNFWSV